MEVAAPAAGYGTPVTEEIEAFDLAVEGALPPELCGDYIRNGPNPPPGTPAAHLFFGDGMLHGIRIENGRARAYRNRWVRTRAFVEHAPHLRPDGTMDLTVSVANTNIIDHGRKLLALVETSFPTEVTRELGTIAPYDFGGKLKTPFTAHPKTCPLTGELHAFGMALRPAALTYHRIDAAGDLIESRPIPVKGTTMMHDFALTRNYAVFMDLPVVFDTSRAMKGQMPYRWDDGYGARLGVIARNDPVQPVQWINVGPCYVFHVANAYEDGGKIVVDVVRYPELWRDGSQGLPPTTLHRWTIDTVAGSVSEATLDERSLEFPRVDERLLGSSYRFAYGVAARDGDGTKQIRKYDLAGGTSAAHDFGAAGSPGEFVFVPAATGEDAGWLVGYVYDAAIDRSAFVVLDARNVTAPPVARVPLPVRVPLGFHGNWIADHAV